MDFQDVYHTRKRDNSISRLPSIRQSPREEEEEEEREEAGRRVRISVDEQPNEKAEKRPSQDSQSTQRAGWRPRSRSSANRGSVSNAV
jgi:hypothetical protein